VRRHLLDTPLLAAYLFNRPHAVALISPWIRQREAATSILVYGEVNEYIQGNPNYVVFHARLLELLQEIPPLFLTYPIMRRYGEIRRALRRTNSLIGDVDTLIAATAIERNLTVVTADGDFQRVPGLMLTLVLRSQLGR
jgi:predicted nucleic acid-binding protein